MMVYYKKNKNIYLIIFLLVCFFYISCESNKLNENITRKLSAFPIKHGKYVDLKEIYDIDITQISMFGKEYDFRRFVDFDKNNNLYILDGYEGTIYVFDEGGKLKGKFGKRGQGPNEFNNANGMVIKDDKIYVFQGFHELKILNLEGEYISKKTVNIENRLRVEGVGENFYLIRGKTDHTFTKLELIMSIENEFFSGGKELFRYNYPLGLSGPPCWEWMLILDNGEFYFPEDNFKKYSIIKYNQSGKPMLIFGREFKIEKYSREARDLFYSTYKKAIERGDLKFFETPPIIRMIFQDERKNIWVVSGEVYEDNLIQDYKNSIDIFNEKGDWLYSFNSKKISKNCFYNDDKIYKVLPLNLDNFTQLIKVYRINYIE